MDKQPEQSSKKTKKWDLTGKHDKAGEETDEAAAEPR